MVSANRFDRIYEELAKKYGRSKREIKNICDSPFLMLREFYKFASKYDVTHETADERRFQILMNRFGKFGLNKAVLWQIEKKKIRESKDSI